MTTIRTIDAELLLDAGAELGESPLWDPTVGRLRWVDILPGEIHELDVASGVDRSVAIGPTVGAIALRAEGGLLLARNHGVSSLADDGSVTVLAEVASEADRPGLRLNDGKCDPAGRFWAGSIVMDKSAPDGALYRFDPDGAVTTMRSGVTVSNGLGWSPDGTLMYYIDSMSGGVDAHPFDAERGEIGDRRRFVDVPLAVGEPDGLTIDATGCVWFAIWRAGEVRRYTPDGVLDTVVRVPASLTTSCCFGGADLDTLFLTTARCDLSVEQRTAEPHAGALFACHPGITGLPPVPFAG